MEDDEQRTSFPNKPADSKPAVWLLSAYRADSHGSWTDWLTTHHDNVRWHLLELPGQHFRWRIRSNPLSWIDQLPDSRPDLILATSMVDLACLKGINPGLSDVPAWCYFHENQFAYPKNERQTPSLDHKMVQIYSGLAADRLFFNSEFNRTTYLKGIRGLLKKKSEVDADKICRKLKPKCSVLPIPVAPVSPAPEKDPALILWNHRWEYDKAPQVFLKAVRLLAKKGVSFRLALLGDRSSKPHPALLELRASYPDYIIADEKADSETYRQILSRASIAVSSAIHEFQGLAMLEAASAEVRPLVPDHLCYPEMYPVQYRYPPGDHKALAYKMEKWLTGNMPDPLDVSSWTGPDLRKRWSQLFRL